MPWRQYKNLPFLYSYQINIKLCLIKILFEKPLPSSDAENENSMHAESDAFLLNKALN